MIYSILFAILATLSYWYWRTKYIPAEVALNAAAFDRNGAADDLQTGYHQRRTWARIWPGLACCLVPSVAPAALLWGASWAWQVGVAPPWQAVGLAFLAVAALLAGVFARDFTPKLNLARAAAGQWWISEWTASAASKSWPDAKAWRAVRPRLLPATDNQPAADAEMKAIILSTWRWCLIAAGLLAGGAVWVAVK